VGLHCARSDTIVPHCPAKLAFNPNRVDSTVTVVHEDSPVKFSVVGTAHTGGAARTCAVDPKTHKLYVFYYEGNPRRGGKLVAAPLAP
jgi:DNA-binding beta-propeller fold protein YncE